MTAVISVYGRFARDPRQYKTRSGKPMTTATIAVDVEARGGDECDEGILWLQLVGFGRQADDRNRRPGASRGARDCPCLPARRRCWRST